MSRKKISTTIYVTPEQSEKLKLLHDRTKVPVAVYIREGIDLVLRHYGHLLPGQLALDGSGGGGGRPDRGTYGARSAQASGDDSGEHEETDRAASAPSSASAGSESLAARSAHAAAKK
jgi:hypothetical protein